MRLAKPLLWLMPLLAAATPSTAVEAAHVNVIELDNQIISPVTQQYITDAIARSETDGAVGLVIELDTPGGLLESTRAIVKRIMNAKVPVIVYVAPSGSRAGSAGLFITLAGHVAAMAPSTNIGAAHPVTVGEGGGVRKLIRRIKQAGDNRRARDHEEVVEEETDPMTQKIVNDTLAWVTTIAQARGRNTDLARKAVTDSFSVTDTEAVQERLVDLVAPDLPALLAQIDGRAVEVAGVRVELRTKGAEAARIPMSRRQEFLAAITHPNIAYLLMLLGTLGLVFEFTHPGIGFPGIAGLICVLLAFYAFQALPVSYAALALIALGLALLIAEIKVVSYGMLAVGGVISLTLGSLLLFESPDPAIQVSLRVIVPAVATLAGIILFILQRAVSAQRKPVATGAQGLLGEIGVATTALAPEGKVFVHGELWDASSPRPVPEGRRVRVVRVDGLHLLVEPQEPGEARPPARPAARRGGRRPAT